MCQRKLKYDGNNLIMIILYSICLKEKHSDKKLAIFEDFFRNSHKLFKFGAR